jgi:hypothetical protein
MAFIIMQLAVFVLNCDFYVFFSFFFCFVLGYWGLPYLRPFFALAIFQVGPHVFTQG